MSNYQTPQNEKNTIYLRDSLLSEKTYWPAGNYPLHYHNYFELELVVDGHGSEIFNGKFFLLTPGDILLLRPLDCHANHSDGITFQHIQIKEDALPRWINEDIHSLHNPQIFHLDEESFALYRHIMDSVEKEIAEKKPHYLETSYLLAELIFTYFLRMANPVEKGKEENIMTKVMFYLQEERRYTRKVTLDEIASYVGYSKFYVSNLFHRLSGMTIQTYVSSLRVEYAKKLLLKGDEPITSIAQSCGFSSPSNFYAQFERIVGDSPSVFRKKNVVS